ncbi:MAG TPA: CDGSH iron-sulfur domain-containing protein [Saprospiraceae bacterium]|nr:CDGSH iron-sulfur domain-containing protein [Saprospiraceae bacterium]
MKKIVIQKNGPFEVYGGIPLRIEQIVANEEGKSWNWQAGQSFETEEGYQLCRCGHSRHKPFCDDSHLKVGFHGEETASRQPYDQQARYYEGPTVVMGDVHALCASARFCSAKGNIRQLIQYTDDPEARDLLIREVLHCPSGRLTVIDKITGQEIERTLEAGIGIVEDLPMGCSGPLWVKGGVRIESSDGQVYETRNRVTLCRCGASHNKPFCDGSHLRIGFNDGMMD